MHKIRGKAISNGKAIGSAAIMRPPYFIPEVPIRYSVQVSRVRTDEPLEQLDVVLICDKMSRADGFSSAWANVVGIIVSEGDTPPIRTKIPILIIPEDMYSTIDDDVIVLVDGDREIALIDPDPIAIAQFQSEHHRIRPRTRIYLDEKDQPIVTLDNVKILVGGSSPLDSLGEASESGADFIFVDGSKSNSKELLKPCGKPISIYIPIDELDIEVLLKSAVINDIHLVVKYDENEQLIGLLLSEFNSINQQLLDEDVFGTLPKFTLMLGLHQNLEFATLDSNITRIMVEIAIPKMLSEDETLNWFDAIAKECISRALSLEVIIPNGDETTIETVLCLGANAVLVGNHFVQHTKEFIRNFCLSEARSRLFSGDKVSASH